MRRIHRRHALIAASAVLGVAGVLASMVSPSEASGEERSRPVPVEPHMSFLTLDEKLASVLAANGFTGRIESTLETRLGRPVDHELADLGRMLFFDKVLALHV